MFSLPDGQLHLHCPRREFLRYGAGLAAMGGLISPLTSAFGAEAKPASGKSCIFVYLLGGPPHLDTFDLKPDAPTEIRGPFQPIATSVPGVSICEHLPKLANLAHRYALVRSVSHPNSNHTPMIYYTLTGRVTALPAQDNDIRPPLREDFPHHGSVVSNFRSSRSDIPGYVAIPELAIRSSLSGEYKRVRSPLRGGNAGFLGSRLDPLAVNGEPGTPQAIPALALPEGMSLRRFEERADFLAQLDKGKSPATSDGFEAVRKRAILLTGAANDGRSPLFSLEEEPAKVRDRYGRHRFGQALLLARRLTEAGVPFVAVHFNEMTVCDGWDTHSKNFEACQTELLPYLDQGMSALIEDLHDRGRLDDTLIACLGEFGRTPKINANAGRDHWGDCSSALLAGGGICGGQVLGESDRQGAFPKSDKIDPVDLQATMYHCLGLNLQNPIYDQLHRPHAITTGKVVRQLL
ncbi:MAG: DUF1501 domain-containing protein [Pirellulaceae bacterium]